MRVHHAPDLRKRLVEVKVRVEVGGGAQLAPYDLSLEIRDHQIVGLHALIGNAARLDGDEVVLPADAADIAEGVKHQAAAHHFQIGFQNLLAQLLQHQDAS
jgi:hypothetical protein